MVTRLNQTEHPTVRLQRILRWGARVVIIIALLALAQLVISRSTAPVADFRAFYEGAVRLRAGLPLYQVDVDFFQTPIQYIYPPLVALLLLPFPSYTIGWYAWALLSLASWGGALWLIIRALRPALLKRVGPLWWPVLLAALANFPPVSSHFFWGQTQLPLLLLLAGAWLLLREDRDGWAGALLGVAIAVKLFPALLGLPLLLWGRWRALAAAAIVCLGVTALSYAAVGFEQAPIFVDLLLRHGRTVVAVSTAHTTFAAMFTNLTGAPALAGWLSLAIRVAIMLLVGWACWRAEHAAHAFAIALPTLFLVTPVVWEHYFVLAYLPWLVALARANRRETAALVGAFILLAASSAVYSAPAGWLWLVQLLPLSGGVLLIAIMTHQVLDRTRLAQAEAYATWTP